MRLYLYTSAVICQVICMHMPPRPAQETSASGRARPACSLSAYSNYGMWAVSVLGLAGCSRQLGIEPPTQEHGMS